jgi:hypothetical protein
MAPSYRLWSERKLADIFNYDVYKALGMKADQDRWHKEMTVSRDNFPTLTMVLVPVDLQRMRWRSAPQQIFHVPSGTLSETEI